MPNLVVWEEGLETLSGREAVAKAAGTARQIGRRKRSSGRFGPSTQLLGPQQFAQARAILEELAKQHPGEHQSANCGVCRARGIGVKKQARLVQGLEGCAH